jgi:hypothetical protein
MPMAALAASPFQPEGESHHGIAVDQRLELGQHRVQHGLPALGRYSLAVAGQPVLERVLAARQPASPTPRVSVIEWSVAELAAKRSVIGPRLTSAGVI